MRLPLKAMVIAAALLRGGAMLCVGLTIYPATFFACARNFAHRFFVALPILALAAADKTRFFTIFSSLLVESPSALAAACTP